jgi:nucleoside-diphosphate-sugar epimerase
MHTNISQKHKGHIIFSKWFFNKKIFSVSMLALVTGGTGFIGSFLIDELLAQGYDVRALRRNTSNTRFVEGKKVNVRIGDLTDYASLVQACQQIDIVFHVAALPRDWGPKKIFLKINFDGTKNLLDACVTTNVPRCVFMSSAAVYGFPRSTQPITEKSPINPTAKYGESKLCAEEVLWDYGRTHHMTVTAVRSPLVIGPRDRMVAHFLINALQQQRLFYIGSGEQKLSISDGRDVAHCLRLAGESRKANGQAYNVKSFDSTPKELIETLAERLGCPVPQTHRSYPGAYVLASIIEGIWILRRKQNPPFTRHKVKVLGRTRQIDITKAQQELQYTPVYNCASTIDDMVTWYLTQKHRSATGPQESRR